MSDADPNIIHIEWARRLLGVDALPSKVRSGAHSAVYELKANDRSWYLKVGEDLESERQRMQWLQSKLAVPEVIAFDTHEDTDLLLMSAIQGTDLAHLSAKLKPSDIVSRLASALRTFHSVAASDCPFRVYKPGNILVHGDACLPNIIFDKTGALSGYIDLGDMGVGDVEVDLSAAVWSLNYNLGPGYGLRFLIEYGLKETTGRDVERLWTMYAESPIFDR
jgi:kanamycin kinase